MVRRGARALGQAGEALAAAHLARLGYTILARNVRVGRGEIDLLARHGDDLVFVEVRMRRSGERGTAAASFDRRKQARLRPAVLAYMSAAYGDAPPPWRVDVVAIDLDRTGRIADIVILPAALEEDS
jgi:putative endonuclease